MIITPDYQILVYPDAEENRGTIREIMGTRSYEIVTELTRPGLIFSWLAENIPVFPHTYIYLMFSEDVIRKTRDPKIFENEIKSVKWISLEGLKKNILKLLYPENSEKDYIDTLRRNGKIDKPIYPISLKTERYIEVYNLLVV